jgi:hypothetical protein
VHGAEGRNAAHVSWGGVVPVEPGVELGVAVLVAGVAETGEPVEFGMDTCVPGPPVLVPPQEVNDTARNKDGTIHFHNQLRFTVLPRKWTERSIYGSIGSCHRFERIFFN